VQPGRQIAHDLVEEKRMTREIFDTRSYDGISVRYSHRLPSGILDLTERKK